MAKKCELTGKNPMKGHNVSHANNKTKRRFLPNLKKVKFTSELLNRSLKLTVSNAGVRSVDKKGSFDEFLKSVKNKNLSPRLKKLKKNILIKSPFQKNNFMRNQMLMTYDASITYQPFKNAIFQFHIQNTARHGNFSSFSKRFNQ